MMPAINADVIIPTVTNVYFEENGQAYNGKIEFTVKGYGYGTGMPGDPNFEPNKEPGTYTPEVVYQFSATYNKYGDKIYENYYMNYLHIDYYELEGKTADGRTFIIRNIEKVPMNCNELYQYNTYDGKKYYKTTEEYHTCSRENYDLQICRKYLKEVPESEIKKDPEGHPLEQECELRFNLDEADWDFTPPTPAEPRGFWEKIVCFFKSLFGGSC